MNIKQLKQQFEQMVTDQIASTSATEARTMFRASVDRIRDNLDSLESSMDRADASFDTWLGRLARSENSIGITVSIVVVWTSLVVGATICVMQHV